MQQHHDEPQVIKLNTQFLFLKNFTYIIFNAISKEAVIVDPAWKIDKIEQMLRSKGATLRGILVTHTHLDHVHLVKPLEKKYHCPVWLSLKEYENSSFRCRSLQVLENEQPFFCGSIKVKPLLTPGHTPGSMCYLIGNSLFTGDTLFTEGCGICTDAMANPHDMFFSLQRLKASIHLDTRIYPGHSFGKIPGKIFAEVMEHNLYLSFEKEENFVAFRMRKGQKNLFNFQWGSE
ncbi:MAG: MBL fold metallo-hydrolase [Waddliaceae bacterium]